MFENSVNPAHNPHTNSRIRLITNLIRATRSIVNMPIPAISAIGITVNIEPIAPFTGIATGINDRTVCPRIRTRGLNLDGDAKCTSVIGMNWERATARTIKPYRLITHFIGNRLGSSTHSLIRRIGIAKHNNNAVIFIDDIIVTFSTGYTCLLYTARCV